MSPPAPDPAPIVVPEPRLPAAALVEPPPPTPSAPRAPGLDWVAAAAAGEQGTVGGPVVGLTGTLVPRIGLLIGLVYGSIAQSVEAAAFVVWRLRDQSTAQALIDADDTISRAAVPVAVVTLVSLLVWTFLVVRNARRLGLRSAAPLVASLCWLVPIVNLFVPWRQLRTVSRHVRATAPVGVWWVFALAGATANRMVRRLVANPGDDLPTALTRLAAVSSAAALCVVIASIAAIRSISAIHRASRARAERGH